MVQIERIIIGKQKRPTNIAYVEYDNMVWIKWGDVMKASNMRQSKRFEFRYITGKNRIKSGLFTGSKKRCWYINKHGIEEYNRRFSNGKAKDILDTIIPAIEFDCLARRYGCVMTSIPMDAALEYIDEIAESTSRH